MCFKAYCVSVKVKKQNQNSKYHHEFADSVKVDTKLQKGQFQKVIEIWPKTTWYRYLCKTGAYPIKKKGARQDAGMIKLPLLLVETTK